jgi:hypothetical protein
MVEIRALELSRISMVAYIKDKMHQMIVSAAQTNVRGRSAHEVKMDILETHL